MLFAGMQVTSYFANWLDFIFWLVFTFSIQIYVVMCCIPTLFSLPSTWSSYSLYICLKQNTCFLFSIFPFFVGWGHIGMEIQSWNQLISTHYKLERSHLWCAFTKSGKAVSVFWVKGQYNTSKLVWSSSLPLYPLFVSSSLNRLSTWLLLIKVWKFYYSYDICYVNSISISFLYEAYRMQAW